MALVRLELALRFGVIVEGELRVAVSWRRWLPPACAGPPGFPSLLSPLCAAVLKALLGFCGEVRATVLEMVRKVEHVLRGGELEAMQNLIRDPRAVLGQKGLLQELHGPDLGLAGVGGERPGAHRGSSHGQ